MTTEDKIEQYTEYRQQYELVQAEMERARDIVLAKVQAELDDINAEFLPKIAAVSTKVAELAEEIKGEVLSRGASVKGSKFNFVFSNGAVRWDSERLKKMVKQIPELALAQKEGEASVSIREIKEK